MRSGHQDGYTLVELMVVVSILALLAILAVPQVSIAFSRAKEVQVREDMEIISRALELHNADHGYYPTKLNDLVDGGYLPNGTSFKSPVSGYWYFYAVDDNTIKNGVAQAHAYVLGAPGRDAGPEDRLYHSGPLPRGRKSYWKARAWRHWQSGDPWLNLYAPDDQGAPIDSGIPDNLELYRNSCQPGSSVPCDVMTN